MRCNLIPYTAAKQFFAACALGLALLLCLANPARQAGRAVS